MFKVYSIDNCGYCSRAFNLLMMQGRDFEAVKLADTEKGKFLDDRGFGPGSRTFPRVYQLNDAGEEVLIGGYDDLRKVFQA